MPPRATVALETTILTHGVPRDRALPLHRRLAGAVRDAGAAAALVGVLRGRPTVGMTDADLEALLAEPEIHKLNTANLGLALSLGWSGSTTVSATVELSARAGVRVFATGGIGGVHHGMADRLDISADLASLARWPVAVVCSGAKSILDVPSTREALETLGVPVVGYRTDRFPAFYLLDSGAGVDATFTDPAKLAAFVRAELPRSRRGIVIANPPPEKHAIRPEQWDAWLGEARSRTAEEGRGATGRDATPRTLAILHELSGGATLECNIALAEANAGLAGQIAAAM